MTTNVNSYINVIGARVHNLKNIDVQIPRGTLTVITGLSGSGKSSLAFDTIYAEGQRRYIETFSAYARNFLGGMERPDVDKITGLSPVIAIEQKTTGKSPRSTVGTTTEVYDYLRLLFARAATAYSWATGEKMVKYTEEQLLDMIAHEYAGKPVYILAPLVRNRKGHYRELFEQMRRKGYLQVRIDEEIRELVPDMRVDRYKNHNIEVIVDKLKAPSTPEDPRLRKSITAAMQLGDGLIQILVKGEENAKFYSKRLMCPTTGMAYKDPAPNIFSFNSPEGACPYCRGLGFVDADDPLADLEKADNKKKTSDKETDDNEADNTVLCPACQGARLNPEALSYRIWDKNIHQLASMDIDQLQEWLCKAFQHIETKQQHIAEQVLKEIRTRLQFMLDVGLNYLSLARPSASLSGGESQRIRLATQIGSQLVNVLYILDEPSIGLHQRDNERLITSLKRLRDMGNTVIVVEHDEDMMRAADYIIDIGPTSGRKGGYVVFQGTPYEMLQTDTLTAQYLNGKRRIEIPDTRRGLQTPAKRKKKADSSEKDSLILRGAKGNNLKNVNVEIPLGRLVVVTGVSGSGKSTLINDTLQPAIARQLYRSTKAPLPYDTIEGLDRIDKMVSVDQTPIGRTPRSNPATYTGVFSAIRSLFVALPEAKIRGYKPGRFSFNVKGGRCETCTGNGYKTIEMNFLPDVFVPCEACLGKRYNRETLEVRYKGKNIAEVLDMTVNQAVDFFEAVPSILKKIKSLQDVGLGYIKLGQPSTTLSGGESQRVKLATELAKRDTGKTLYILDEPTTGLHFEDIRILMQILEQLVERGNTVVVIEHNLDVIKLADHLIELGPEGGRQGGRIIACGTPEQLAARNDSPTAPFLKKILKP